VTRVRGWRQLQPFRDGTYATSGGSADGFDSLIVAVDCAGGVTGWGEMAPLGSFYDAAFAAGAQAAARELAPLLVGADPRQPQALMRRMDAALRGHPYAKSAFSIALWDAAARIAEVPLCEALGGRFCDAVALYRAVAPLEPLVAAGRAAAYMAQGYRRLQVKVGGDADTDAERLIACREAVGPAVVLYADANGGYSTAQARRFLSATRSVDYTLEQPCQTLEACAAIRRVCDRPLVLDETIVSVESIISARDAGADGVTIKLARVGGVTPAVLMRDVAVAVGLDVTIEDTGGASIDTAAMLQVSASTPNHARVHTVDFNAWVTVDNADGLAAPAAGALAVPTGPGLGVTVREASLGEPAFRFE
jgi:cis-L-3-hydroxyproline dehydratase